MILPPPVSIQTQWWWYNSMGTRIIAFFLLIFHNFCNCREGRMMIIKRYYPQNCPIHHTTPFYITTHPLPALANVFEKSRQIQIICKYIHLFTFRYDLSILSKSKVYANYPKIAGNSKRPSVASSNCSSHHFGGHFRTQLHNRGRRVRY